MSREKTLLRRSLAMETPEGFKKVTVVTVMDYYIPDYMTCGFPTLKAMCDNWFKEFPAGMTHAARDGCDRIFVEADYIIEGEDPKPEFDSIMRAGFDHPCRQTCSGWRQGRERGQWETRYVFTALANLVSLKALKDKAGKTREYLKANPMVWAKAKVAVKKWKSEVRSEKKKTGTK